MLPADNHEQIEFSFEPDPISDHFIVTESNVLIEAKTNLTLHEERLIYILASRIHPEDTQFKTHFFKVSDIAERLDIKDKNFYKRVRDLIRQLQDKKVVIEEKATRSVLEAHWLASARYFQGKGLIELEFAEQLKPYLLQLKANFTHFKLWNILYLRSSHSLKLYKLLKQYLPLGKRKFNSIQEFKDFMEVEEGQYDRYSHLKNRVILTAQKELANKTDIRFELEEKKVGTRVVSITFHIFKNHKMTEREVLNDGDSVILTEPIMDLLARFEVKKKTALELVSQYGEEHVRENIKYVYEKKQNQEVSSIAGYIVKAIEGNYADSKQQYSNEEEENPKVSTTHLNNRISKLVFYAEQVIKEKVQSEKVALEELYRDIWNAIDQNMSNREEMRCRPLVLEDLYHHHAKTVFLQIENQQLKRLAQQAEK